MPKKYINVTEVKRNGRVLQRARLVFPRDPVTGIRPPAKDFYGETEADADRKRAEYAKRYNTRATESGKQSFGAFLAKEFLPFEETRFRAGDIGWNHYKLRKSRIERFVVNYPAAARLCAVPVTNVTPDLIERLFRTLRADTKITARVFNELIKDMGLALRLAKRALPERWDDYLADVETRTVVKRAKDVFDADAVIEKIRDDRLDLMARLFVAFLFVMNCRPQDMFALRWSDLDLEEGAVTFTNAVKATEEGWQVQEGTKTGLYDGLPLPLGSLLVDLLKRAYAARKAAGKAYPWVFCREDGKPMNNDHMNEVAWPRIRAALGLPKGPTFYSLKTLGNSYWLANGVSTAAQARKMRHSTTRMADNEYRKVFPIELERAVEVPEAK